MAEVSAGQYFAWDRTVLRAEETCKVSENEIIGDAREIVRFEDDCTLKDATIVLDALHADPLYLSEELTDGD